MSKYFSHPSACIDFGAKIGDDTKIWHFSHVMSGAEIGERCSLGQNCFVGDKVKIGSHVKIQNNVSIYNGTIIEDDVFLGPSCVLTNIPNPRAQIDRSRMFETTLIKKGCTIGANATIICGVTLGKYAFIGAGAVVTKDVPDYALIIGVPGRHCGWMSKHGARLQLFDENGISVCLESGLRYTLDDMGILYCLDNEG